MPTAKVILQKALCVDDLRHVEYYGLQETFDGLYAKSKEGEVFTNLMGIILSRENILLAYRNIKTNQGSKTRGTDNVTIDDIGGLSPEEVVEKVRFIVTGSPHGYRPRPVRRKDIPKPNGSTRPLGIPCMWDRLVQQCIKQVMEPICEAKFSDHSYGFRPQRSVENAIAECYKMMQRSHLTQVIEFDIKGFFDNVDHTKLVRQIWAMGIHDKHLIYVILRILKAPIRMPDSTIMFPAKGTPQGGIISPLLANIVLNELDHWVESNWQENPVVYKYPIAMNKNGSHHKSNGFKVMKKTGLKEMYIVRYADDFRIFCRTRKDAAKTKAAITLWLKERLKLDVSPEKTRIVNVKRHNSEFLGFKFKLRPKEERWVIRSHMCDKAIKRQKQVLADQAKNIARPRDTKAEADEVRLYNQKVTGMQNYYCIATEISADCKRIGYEVNRVFYNRLGTKKGERLRKIGRRLTEFERKRYGKSEQLCYVAGSEEPIYPIGYVQHHYPVCKKRETNAYTPEGREAIHSNLNFPNKGFINALMTQPLYDRSIEYADNRISKFSAQWGKCAVTGTAFQCLSEIHCHHINARSMDRSDRYDNLVLVLESVHRLIHATSTNTIQRYLDLLNLKADQIKKLNKLREAVGNKAI